MKWNTTFAFSKRHWSATHVQRVSTWLFIIRYSAYNYTFGNKQKFFIAQSIAIIRNLCILFAFDFNGFILLIFLLFLFVCLFNIFHTYALYFECICGYLFAWSIAAFGCSNLIIIYRLRFRIYLTQYVYVCFNYNRKFHLIDLFDLVWQLKKTVKMPVMDFSTCFYHRRTLPINAFSID